MGSQGNQVPSFPDTQRINPEKKEHQRMNLLLSKLYTNPAANMQHKIFTTKLFPQMYTQMMEKKQHNFLGKDLQVEPMKGSGVDQLQPNQQLHTAPKAENPLLRRDPSGLWGKSLDLPTTMYVPTQNAVPAFPLYQQLLNPNEKLKLQSQLPLPESNTIQRRLPNDMYSFQGHNPFPTYMSQPPFSMNQWKIPTSLLNPNPTVLNLPQIPTVKTEAPGIPMNGYWDPTQAEKFPQVPGFKVQPNTFWPVPPNKEKICGFRFFENAWWPVRKPVRLAPKRPNFHCRDCKTTFEATILKKSNNGAVQHRCSFVGRAITRRVGIRSKVCKGKHDGACIIPLKELKEDEKAVDKTSKSEVATVFCSNVEDLTYIKQYSEYEPLCRIRVWRLPESKNWGSKPIVYYDCQCNQLFPPVANIEVAKKHASQHSARKNCCDICGKWFTHHLQVNAHKKIHKVHTKKNSKCDASSNGTLVRKIDQRGTLCLKRQKIYHERTVPKTEPTLAPAKPISWPPAMFQNPQFLLNGRLGMEGDDQNAQRTQLIANPPVPGQVMPGLQIPNLPILGAIRSTPTDLPPN